MGHKVKSWDEVPYMDEETYRMYLGVAHNSSGRPSIPLPLALAEAVGSGGYVVQKDCRELYLSYKLDADTRLKSVAEHYAECYKLLAFTCYGYGNWSNTDRRRKGLGMLRHHRAFLHHPSIKIEG